MSIPFDGKGLHPETLAVRSGTMRSDFNEHAEALFLTSSFCYANSAEAADKFAHAETGFIYSRFTNPTVKMFQEQLIKIYFQELEQLLVLVMGVQRLELLITLVYSFAGWEVKQ